MSQITSDIRIENGFSENQINESFARLRESSFLSDEIYYDPNRMVKYIINKAGDNAYLSECLRRQKVINKDVPTPDRALNKKVKQGELMKSKEWLIPLIMVFVAVLLAIISHKYKLT